MEFHWWKVKLTMLQDREKRSKVKMLRRCAPVENYEKNSGAFLVDFLPTSSVATWRIGRVLVVPSGGEFTN